MELYTIKFLSSFCCPPPFLFFLSVEMERKDMSPYQKFQNQMVAKAELVTGLLSQFFGFPPYTKVYFGIP